MGIIAINKIEEDQYKDTTTIMQLMRDNLTNWNADKEEVMFLFNNLGKIKIMILMNFLHQLLKIIIIFKSQGELYKLIQLFYINILIKID